MHLLLTDQLICPRCGPGFGLILLADLLEDRRVIEGSLGCPNCRDRFPVEGGFGDLRPPPRSTDRDAPDLEPPASPQPVEIAALLGLTGGAGNVALLGDVAGHATALAQLVPGVEFIGIAPGLRGWEEGEGVSRMTAGAALPFRTGSLRGVGLFANEWGDVSDDPTGLDAGSAGALPAVGALPVAGRAPVGARASTAGELARVITAAGRIAVWGAVAGWEEALRSRGLEVLASEDSAVVAKAAP